MTYHNPTMVCPYKDIECRDPLCANDCKRDRPKSEADCPNGHSQAYVTSEADRLRTMLEEANRKATYLAADVQSYSARAIKAEKTLQRERKRISGGVCPCCNRTFVSLGRHMATKHPDFVAPKK